MDGFKLFLERDLGEYWIEADGSVAYADGDVGDVNHENYVLERVQRDIISDAESHFDVKTKYGRRYSDDEYMDWDGFVRSLAEAYLENKIEENPSAREQLEEEYENDPDAFSAAAFKEMGVNEELLAVASGGIDPKTYAMQRWGWKIFRDGHITTWTFRLTDLEAIATGIYEICYGMNERQLNRYTFSISVYSNRKEFSLTYAQMNRRLQKGTTAALPDEETFGHGNKQAGAEIRNYEYDQLLPAYKRPGASPFGDWNTNE